MVVGGVALALAGPVARHCGGDPRRLLMFSIAGGPLGAEWKLRTPEMAVALPVPPAADPYATADELWPWLRDLAARPPVVDRRNRLTSATLDGPCHLGLDVRRLPGSSPGPAVPARIAEVNPFLRITIPPKSLPCYTDADGPFYEPSPRNSRKVPPERLGEAGATRTFPRPFAARPGVIAGCRRREQLMPAGRGGVSRGGRTRVGEGPPVAIDASHPGDRCPLRRRLPSSDQFRCIPRSTKDQPRCARS
jgi:hypothetical protein